MTVKFLDLSAQYVSIADEVDAVWSRVHRDSQYVGGPLIAEFEDDFAHYLGAQHVVAVANGTDALELALGSLDLEPGSTVLVPGNSFIASAEAVTRSGFRVRFVDVDDTYTLDVDAVMAAIDESVSCIIAVHLYGQPADMHGLLDIARRYDLKVIEDCAQAHGAEINGQKVGTFGHAAAFSFYPGKTLGAYGDAGAVVTDDEALAESVRRVANHGRLDKFDHALEGRNSRLDPLQAGVLSVKLRHFPQWLAHRREVAANYDAALAANRGLLLPPRKPIHKHGQHLYVILTDRRDELRAHLGRHGIETGLHYPVALPELKAYAGRHLGICPRSSLNASRVISLPMGEHLSGNDVSSVVAAIDSFGWD